MDVDFEFTVARLAKIANNNNFVGLLGNSGQNLKRIEKAWFPLA